MRTRRASTTEPWGAQWREHNRCYAVLHLFDHDGHHTASEIVREPASDAGASAEAEVEAWLAALPGLAYGHIAVRPFRIVLVDVVFGLILRRWTADGIDWGRAELHPEDLSFSAPWNGLYDT